jgi:prepilin-type N-terminal cleavage/methylation domain-containing protein
MKNEKGFSLVEVMIGLTILSIGLMGIAELMILSIKNNRPDQIGGISVDSSGC